MAVADHYMSWRPLNQAMINLNKECFCLRDNFVLVSLLRKKCNVNDKTVREPTFLSSRIVSFDIFQNTKRRWAWLATTVYHRSQHIHGTVGYRTQMRTPWFNLSFYLVPIISIIWASSWENLLCHMRTTNAQMNLRIRAVWSASLLFAAYIV